VCRKAEVQLWKLLHIFWGDGRGGCDYSVRKHQSQNGLWPFLRQIECPKSIFFSNLCLEMRQELEFVDLSSVYSQESSTKSRYANTTSAARCER
jgi:hypothetical protein